jgi:hypothetical protein
MPDVICRIVWPNFGRTGKLDPLLLFEGPDTTEKPPRFFAEEFMSMSS